MAMYLTDSQEDNQPNIKEEEPEIIKKDKHKKKDKHRKKRDDEFDFQGLTTDQINE